jgi:hypothetical protein
MSENTRLIYDLLQYTEDKNIPGWLLLFDSDKAFDSLSWYLFFVFIYVYWCSTRFPYQMMFASFNCNCVTSWAGTTNPSGAPEYTPVFSAVRVAQSLAFYAVFCISLFVLLSFFFWSLYCQSFLDLRLLIISFF